MVQKRGSPVTGRSEQSRFEALGLRPEPGVGVRDREVVKQLIDRDPMAHPVLITNGQQPQSRFPQRRMQGFTSQPATTPIRIDARVQ